MDIKEIIARSYDPEFGSCILSIRKMDRDFCNTNDSFLDEIVTRFINILKPPVCKHDGK